MCDKCKPCECSCEYEIDCSRPEDYEIQVGSSIYYPIVLLYKKTRSVSTNYPYVVVYLNPEGYEVTRNMVSASSIRKKKKWKPTPGKYYLFSNSEDEMDTNRGFLREFIRVEEDGYYLARGAGTEDVRWLYCWSVDKDLLGD